jgi:hypothetical protein
MLPIPTPDQVRALTTDLSVQRAAAGLAAPRHWTALGRSERAVFGACQGSGKEPYAVAVDLSGPVFRCSCPSRKFPCKHGLALAIMAANDASAIPTGDEPADVAAWLDGRGAKAKGAAGKPGPGAPAVVDTQAAEKRADARERKVAAGLDELDRWIGDIVRRGLAATRTEGYAFWDAEAARLVDAQAGSLARSVRNLGSVIAEGPDWPDRVLRRLARLHLVANAYERIDRLPPGLAADVRSAIGWTIREDDLPPDDAVADRWLVVGRTLDASDDLSTARTWLLGEQSGRIALHLAFGVRGVAPRSVGSPGMILEGTCRFYPSATPLRAAIEPSAVVGTVADIPGDATLDTTAARFAGRMASNPFLDSWPVAIAGVRIAADAGAWYLADASGAVVPCRSAASAVQLLALTAGQPCTVFGEWSSSGVRLLSAVADGRLAELSPPLLDTEEIVPFQPPADDAWGLLVSAALLGTERAELPRDLPIPGDGLLPETRLLAAASVEATRRRAGSTAAKRAMPSGPPAPGDPRPLPPMPAVWLLLAVLRSGADQAPLLAEWVAIATRAGVRPPDEALPALVAAGARNPDLGVAVARLAGPRAAWLADRQPESMAGLRRPTTMTPEIATRLLETGPGIVAVRALLADLRTSEREAFRGAVDERWSALTREERLAALAVIETDLAADDERWLESRVDDPDASVGARATAVLAQLPGSQVAREARERAATILRLEGRFRPSMVVDPQPGWQSVVAFVAPSLWVAHLRADPSTIAAKAAANEHAAELIPAIAAAAVLHRDADFAEALLTTPAVDHVKEAAPQLLAIVPRDRQARVVADRLPTLDAVAAVSFLAETGDWSDDTATTVLEYLGEVSGQAMWQWKVTPLLRLAAFHLPPAFADAVDDVFSPDRNPSAAEHAAAAVATLRLRQEIHDAFTRPAPTTEGIA